ncbi:MAG: type 4a pilus biogenesis protein PilO [Candidatus Omnitrophica bacterium]|nr:type 4a pilus biogenesis protein PilO [Candidatus Omnitrophota bacterium]
MILTNWQSKLQLDNKKISLILLATFIIIYLDFSFVVKMQIKGIQESDPKISKLKNDIDKLNKDLVATQELKTKQDQDKKSASLKAKKIITEDQIPALMEYISNQANQKKVKINQIKPSREAKVEPAKSSPLLLTLDLSCDYHNLGAFLNDLENAPEYLAVQDLRITRDTKNDFLQNVSLVLKTYVKK